MIAYFYKANPNDKIWRADVDIFHTEEDVKSGRVRVEDIPVQLGPLYFSFDKKKIYNLWTDYPYRMTPEEVELFDKENPFWADFFADRKKGVDKNKN